MKKKSTNYDPNIDEEKRIPQCEISLSGKHSDSHS